MRRCSLLAGAELTYPFGESAAVFKVGDKMFAVLSEDEAPGRLTVKCEPDHGAYLTQHYDDIVPGYHMNKRHWITITLTPLMSRDVVEELIVDSYELVVATLTARVRNTLAPPVR